MAAVCRWVGGLGGQIRDSEVEDEDGAVLTTEGYRRITENERRMLMCGVFCQCCINQHAVVPLPIANPATAILTLVSESR